VPELESRLTASAMPLYVTAQVLSQEYRDVKRPTLRLACPDCVGDYLEQLVQHRHSEGEHAVAP
jgi:hypothetical protein